MSKYQKKVSQKVQIKHKISSQAKRPIEKSSYQKNSNAFRVFTLISVIIGVGVFIGLSASNDDPSPQQTNPPSLPTTTQPTQTTQTTQTAYKIPYSVKTIEGSTIPLSNYQGKTLIIYFTGASCIPCKMQLPFLINNYNEHKSSGKVEVISLDIQGNDISDLATWKSENGITWATCQDVNSQLASYYSIVSMPTLIIVDENGNKINQYVGAQSEDTINAIFDSAIA